MTRKDYTLFFLQLTERLKKGLSLLDQTTRGEVCRFVESRQHKNGGFTGRSENPDYYYSLFGVCLAAALEMQPALEKHKDFILKQEKVEKSGVDRLAFILIRAFLLGNSAAKPSLFSLFRTFFLKNHSVDSVYRIFLFGLTADFLYGNRKILLFPAKIILLFSRPPDDAPCSIWAAYTLARVHSGLKTEHDIQRLASFFDEGTGFRIFHEAEHADLLSTAVALFALKTAGADLRMVTPACLGLVQQNYDAGAFLSGDGDFSRDLEYTFYGLLTLGTLS